MACALTPFGMENGTFSSPPPSDLNTEKSQFLRGLLESKTFYDYILTARSRLIPKYFDEVFPSMGSLCVPSDAIFNAHELAFSMHLSQKLADLSVSCFEAALSEQQRAVRSEGQEIGDSEGETTDSSDKKSLPDEEQITRTAFPTEMKNLITSFLPKIISIDSIPTHPMSLMAQIASQERVFDTLFAYFVALPPYMRTARRLGKSGLLLSRKMLVGAVSHMKNYRLLDLSVLRNFGYEVGFIYHGENAGRPFIIWNSDGIILEDGLVHDIGEEPLVRPAGEAAAGPPPRLVLPPPPGGWQP